MDVRVFFISKGDTKQLSKEFNDELSEIRLKYQSGGFKGFTIDPLGASELVDLLGEQERRERQINDTLPIVYDRNKASLIEYSAHKLQGVICTVRGKDIAKLIQGDRANSVFDLNLRRFYGIDKGKVNPDIARTAMDSDDSHRFWFFNNGITIVCDKCEFSRDPDTPHVKLTNLQIVNGYQTSMTLSSIYQNGQVQDDVEVLVKIFQTSDEHFVSRVVMTTNNQNAINSRDLRANDGIQEDYQRAFHEIYGLRYEKKPREFKGLTRDEIKQVISNEKIAQAYLAIVKKKPTIARTQKYRIWDSDLYSQLFPETTVEKHLLAFYVYDFCLKQKRQALETWKHDPIRYSIISYGVFHLARVLAFRYTELENWEDLAQTNRWIEEVRSQPDRLSKHYNPAITLIKNLIKKKPEWVENINNVFKASDIESAINRELHKKVR